MPQAGISLGVGHWRATPDNVIHLQHQIVGARAEMVGLEMGPAVLFMQEIAEAINQAALATGVSYLKKEDRQVALGLAILAARASPARRGRCANFHGVLRDLIDHDVRQRRKGQLPPSGHAAASSPKVGKVLQAGATVINGPGDAAGSFRIVAVDALANALQVIRRGHRPTNLH
jgi:hypothetical protein